MKVLERFHESLIVDRRASVLSRHVSELLPPHAAVLDVGCGDGRIAQLVHRARPDVTISGVDILPRDKTFVPVTMFDGRSLPFPANSFDIVAFVDVLHHTLDPMVLLREAVRVARCGLVIKDHLKDGFLAGFTLRFMDEVGNRRHHVALPYNYWKQSQWLRAAESLDLQVAEWRSHLGIYRWPASLVFDRQLHFAARWIKTPPGNHYAGA